MKAFLREWGAELVVLLAMVALLGLAFVYNQYRYGCTPEREDKVQTRDHVLCVCRQGQWHALRLHEGKLELR